jgi:hypothetical protein
MSDACSGFYFKNSLKAFRLDPYIEPSHARVTCLLS